MILWCIFYSLESWPKENVLKEYKRMRVHSACVSYPWHWRRDAIDASIHELRRSVQKFSSKKKKKSSTWQLSNPISLVVGKQWKNVRYISTLQLINAQLCSICTGEGGVSCSVLCLVCANVNKTVPQKKALLWLTNACVAVFFCPVSAVLQLCRGLLVKQGAYRLQRERTINVCDAAMQTDQEIPTCDQPVLQVSPVRITICHV